MRTFRKYSLETVYVLLALLAVYILPAILRLAGTDDFLNDHYYPLILPVFALVNVGGYTLARRGRYVFAVVSITVILLGQGLFMYRYVFQTPDVWMSHHATRRDCMVYGVFVTLIEGGVCAVLALIVAIINIFRKQRTKDCKRSQI